MTDERHWLVYGLIDPRDRSVFYVGITRDIAARMRGHECDPASRAWNVCQVIKSAGLKTECCVFGTFLAKAAAKILEGRLIVSLPNLVNAKSFHALPSDVLYPDWRNLSIEFETN